MLSLRPPYLLAGNLMIFRDYKEAEAFYYACREPSICISEEGLPAFSAFAIIPESGVGVQHDSILEAGLNIDVELAVSEEDLAEAKSAIQTQYGVHPKSLSPVPLRSGEVYFTMAQSGEAAEKGGCYITSGIKPSMVGSNRASLMVRVTGEDAKRMIAAVDAGTIPASVYYELEMVGITPVYHASIKADMSLIYHHFEKSKKDNFVYYSEEISQIINDLQESKALEIQVEELDPDLKAEAMSSLLSELKSKVIDEFFQPVEFHSEDNKKSSILEKIGKSISQLVTDIIPGRRYVRKTVDESQLRVLTIDLSQSNAKTYPYNPQAQLKDLANRAKVNLSEKIVWISLDDIANKSQEVTVRISADAFDSVNLKSLEVFCQVIDASSDKPVVNELALPTFESGTARTGVFNFHSQRGVDYYYKYRANLLMDSGSDKLPDLLEIPWTRVESPYIYINPAAYYKDYEVDVYLEDRSMFDHTQMVLVDVSAVIGSVDEVVFNRSFLFKKEETDHRHFSVVAGRDTGLRYKIRLTYFLQNLKEYMAEYDNVEGPLFIVPNPFENKWSVDIRCLADWEKYEKIYLRTRVHDPDRKDPIISRFTFTREQADQALYVSCGLNTPEATFEYLVEALSSQKSELLTAGWYSHHGGSILIIKALDDLIPTRVIRIRLADGFDFKKYDVQYIEVSLRFGNGKEESRRLSPDNLVQELYYEPAPGESPVYSYRYKLKCPGNPKSGWEKSDAEDLFIHVDKDLL